jgi:hypothetical protein
MACTLSQSHGSVKRSAVRNRRSTTPACTLPLKRDAPKSAVAAPPAQV